MHLSNQISASRRDYRLTNGRKISLTLLAAVLLVFAALLFKMAVDYPRGREFPLLLGIIFLIPGIWVLLQAWRSRLVLEHDTIELHSAFRVRRAVREEIEGLRTTQNQYGCWTRVYLRQGRGAFSVSDFFTGDIDLKEWFKGIPDLDQRDAEEIEKAVRSRHSPALLDLNAPNLFARAKGWAIGLSILAGATSIPVIWVSYQPVYRTALVLLLACVPVGIVLLHRFPLLFAAFTRKPDPRAELGVLIIWPGLGLLFSFQTANDPAHLLRFGQLTYWVWIILAALFATLFPILRNSPSRLTLFFFMLITGGAYSVGLVNAMNTLLDRSEPQVYQTLIWDMHMSRGNKGMKYYLLVAPWGPIAYSDELDVPKRTYDAYNVGDPVCLGLHPGFLGAPWYSLMPLCRAARSCRSMTPEQNRNRMLKKVCRLGGISPK